MQLSEMQTYVFERLGLSTTTDTALLTSTTLYLNVAVQELVGMYALKTASAALTLTAGTALVTLPTGWLRTLAISQGVGTVQPITDEEFAQKVAAGTATASRLLYYRQASGTQIEVAPTPDATMAAAGATIRYVPTPTALSAASDVPVDIPTPYHPLVCERVVALLAEEEGEPLLVQSAEARADRMEGRMRLFLARRVGQGDLAIPLQHYRR